MRRIFLAGASGSIGKNAQSCIKYLNHHYQKNHQSNQGFKLVGIAAKKNLQEIRKIFDQFPIETAAIDSQQNLNLLKREYPHIKFYSKSEQAIEETHFDILINALSGSCGLQSTVKAITKKSTVLLANKESLVMAGPLIKKTLKQYETELIPIDSEHSALFSLLKNHRQEEISRVILTASGGPFFKQPKDHPTPQEALNHPNWEMGPKISIDSATMMNKGLEVIEAHYLFDLPYKKIETIIHPQSILHSLIETIDGEQYAQLGPTDMRYPIQNALTYPDIAPNPLEKFDLFKHSNLEFYSPDLKKFPLLKIAYECGEKGGNYPVVMNAANEEAVLCFLKAKVTYSDIEKIIVEALEKNSYPNHPNLEEILLIDSEVKARIRNKFN